MKRKNKRKKSLKKPTVKQKSVHRAKTKKVGSVLVAKTKVMVAEVAVVVVEETKDVEEDVVAVG